MTRSRWIAYGIWAVIGVTATGLLSSALESDRWVPFLGLTAVALLGSLIDPAYFGWRDDQRSDRASRTR